MVTAAAAAAAAADEFLDSKSSSERSTRRNCMQKLGAMKPLIHLMVGLYLNILAGVMVFPVLTDVSLKALCPGRDECSQAIYLSGIQQVVAGIGTMFVTPILGELSDHYGRKPMLMIPITASIIPMSIFAYSRTKPFVYANMIVGTIVRMFAEGGVICLSFAYVADCFDERLRAVGISVLMGSLSFGYVTGVLLARILPESFIFTLATALIVCAAIYLKLFLPEAANPQQQQQDQPLLQDDVEIQIKSKSDLERFTPLLMRTTSSIKDTVSHFRNNKLLTQVAVIVFFANLGEAGVQSSLMFFLKATFGFAKDQFAELMMIAGVVSVCSQLLVMPIFVHVLGEKVVLCIGLLTVFSQALLYGIAWAPWVPYLCSSLGLFAVFVFPCIGSIVSKTAGPDEQGKLQGFIAGVKSCATIISPLAISPLTALFLSDNPPFKLPGFSMICSSIVMVVAVIQAFLLQPLPPKSLSEYKPTSFAAPQMHSQEQSQREPLLG